MVYNNDQSAYEWVEKNTGDIMKREKLIRYFYINLLQKYINNILTIYWHACDTKNFFIKQIYSV